MGKDDYGLEDPAPPRLKAELMVGKVIAAFGGEQDGERETTFGTANPTRVERIVVFDKGGDVEHDVADWLCFPKTLAGQLLVPAVIGQVHRETFESAYELIPVGGKKKARAIEGLRAWDEDRKARAKAKKAKRREYNDDDAF